MAETFDCNKVGKLKSTPKHSKDDGNKYVTKLQTQLAEWGYYKKEDIDGDYGPVTAGAVKKFQKKYGLSDDGVFGPEETCPKYNEVINKGTTQKLTAIKDYTLDCKKIGENVPHKDNTKNDTEIVYKIQKNLQSIGYYYLDRSGIFGYFTEEALKTFQKKYNTDHPQDKIREDGHFDKLTCQKLKEAYEAKDKKNKYTIDCEAIDKKIQHKGGTSNDKNVIVKLQSALYHLGFFTRKDTPGTFGNYTHAAVLNFQKRWNTDHPKEKITEDGKFTEATCNKLKKAIEEIKKTTNKQSKAQKPQPSADPYKPNTDNNPIPVEEAQLSIDGIFFRINKVTPNNRYRGGNWKTIDLMQGRKITAEKPAPLEYTLEIYLTNEEFSILDQELDKIGFRVCNVVSTQIVSSKYNISVDVAPQQLTHQKVTMKLTEYLVE